MYIIMNNDKSLIKTNVVKIYQGENLADKVKFLIPTTYKNHDLTQFKIEMKYTDQNNISRTKTLKKETELVKGRILLIFPIKTNLTQFVGDITLSLLFSKDDEEETIIKTDSTTITILEDPDHHTNTDDDNNDDNNDGNYNDGNNEVFDFIEL